MPARPKKTKATDSAPPLRAEDTFENLVTGQGGKNDSRTAGSRGFRRYIRTPQQLIEAYAANWLFGQVVEIPADEMTRERREIHLDDATVAEKIRQAEAKLCLWDSIKTAIKWSDLLGGGGLILGLDGTGDWSTPLIPERVQLGQLKWIHPVDGWSLTPMPGADVQLVIDPTTPNFLRPEFYQVRSSSLTNIHYSRIIRFEGFSLPWSEMAKTYFWGGSKIDRIFDTIADAEQVIGGIADLITEAKIDVYGIKGLMSILATPGGADRIAKRIGLSDRLKSNYQGIIIDAEETYEQKESQLVQGMAAIIQQYLAIVSAASGIPVTRLLGTSAKGLNATGEGDQRNFYDMIDARRETYLRPRLEQLDEILVRSVLGKIPDGYSWEFIPLWQMDETQTAAVELQRAQRDQIYLSEGVIDAVIAARQLHADKTFIGVDEKYIADLEANPPEPQPDPALNPTNPPAKPDPKNPEG